MVMFIFYQMVKGSFLFALLIVGISPLLNSKEIRIHKGIKSRDDVEGRESKTKSHWVKDRHGKQKEDFPWEKFNIPPEQCLDRDNKNCRELAENGECTKKLDDALANCPWSCRFCKRPPIYDPQYCTDLAGSNCKYWKGKGDCIRLPDFMLQNCMETCELCGPETEMMDQDVRCPVWAKEGYCATTQEIHEICLHSCSKYRNVAPAPNPYPYPIIALSPYMPTPLPVTSPPPKTTAQPSTTTAQPPKTTSQQPKTTAKPDQTTTEKPDKTTTGRPEQTTTGRPEQTTTTGRPEQTTTEKPDQTTTGRPEQTTTSGN